jgi:predicted small secreted protein
MRRLVPLAMLLAALVAGCGTTGGSSGDFEGAEQDVADAIEDLETAASEEEPRRVCTQLLAQSLARQLGADCSRAVEQAFDRADTFALSAEDVTVTGTTARARVSIGSDDDQTQVVGLVRERNGWRIATLPGS